MSADPEYVSLLVALDAALLLILAGLAKKQLAWKQAPEPVLRRSNRGLRRIAVGGVCAAAAVATAAAVAGAVAPAAALAYIAAAVFAVFATR